MIEQTTERVVAFGEFGRFYRMGGLEKVWSRRLFLRMLHAACASFHELLGKRGCCTPRSPPASSCRDWPTCTHTGRLQHTLSKPTQNHQSTTSYSDKMDIYYAKQIHLSMNSAR